MSALQAELKAADKALAELQGQLAIARSQASTAVHFFMFTALFRNAFLVLDGHCALVGKQSLSFVCNALLIACRSWLQTAVGWNPDFAQRPCFLRIDTRCTRVGHTPPRHVRAGSHLRGNQTFTKHETCGTLLPARYLVCFHPSRARLARRRW